MARSHNAVTDPNIPVSVFETDNSQLIGEKRVTRYSRSRFNLSSACRWCCKCSKPGSAGSESKDDRHTKMANSPKMAHFVHYFFRRIFFCFVRLSGDRVRLATVSQRTGLWPHRGGNCRRTSDGCAHAPKNKTYDNDTSDVFFFLDTERERGGHVEVACPDARALDHQIHFEVAGLIRPPWRLAEQ